MGRKNYGTVEDLAPSYDEAAAESLHAYGELGSSAKGVVEGIGQAVERRDDAAKTEIVEGTPGNQDVGIGEVAELMDGYDSMLNAVSGEMALLAQSFSNQIGIMNTNYDNLLGAMEANLPNLELHLESKMDALQAASYSGYPAEDPIIEEEPEDPEDDNPPWLNSDVINDIGDHYGIVPQDTPTGAVNLDPQNDSATLADSVAQIFGLESFTDVESIFYTSEPEIGPDGMPTGNTLTGELPEHLRIYQEHYEEFINGNYSYEDAKFLAMNAVTGIYEDRQLDEIDEAELAQLESWATWLDYNTMAKNQQLPTDESGAVIPPSQDSLGAATRNEQTGAPHGLGAKRESDRDIMREANQLYRNPDSAYSITSPFDTEPRDLNTKGGSEDYFETLLAQKEQEARAKKYEEEQRRKAEEERNKTVRSRKRVSDAERMYDQDSALDAFARSLGI